MDCQGHQKHRRANARQLYMIKRSTQPGRGYGRRGRSQTASVLGQKSGSVDEATRRADLIVQLLVELALAGNGTTLFSPIKSARDQRAHSYNRSDQAKKESRMSCRSTPGNTYWSGESWVFRHRNIWRRTPAASDRQLLEPLLFPVAGLVKDAPGLTIPGERAAGCRPRKLQSANSI